MSVFRYFCQWLAPVLTAIIVPAVSLLCAGCEKTNLVFEVLQGTTILPTKVGNKWIYATEIYDSTGRPKPVAARDVVFEITESVNIGDETWFVYGNQLVRNKPDALWKLDRNLHEVVYKFPAHPNYTYRTDGEMITVASVDYPLQINGGTLQCHKYEYRKANTDFVHAIHYCAPHIGLIRVETFDLTSDNRPYLTMAMELKSVILK